MLLTAKLQEVLIANQVISGLDMKKLPVKLAYRFTKILRKLAREVEDFEKTRQQIVQKYLVKKEDGTAEIPDDKRDALAADIDLLLQEETALEVELIPFELVAASGLMAGQAVAFDFLCAPPPE